MNLHSATLDATDLRRHVAMGKIPAYKLPYKAFRLTPDGLAAEPDAGPEENGAEAPQVGNEVPDVPDDPER